MKNFIFSILMFIPLLSSASEWPPELVTKTFNGCVKNGGKSQCDCVVTRLQNKFTFEDIQASRTDRFANQALKQAIKTYNMKCLDADFKKETLMLDKHQ